MMIAELINASNCLVDLRYATKAVCLSDLVRRAAKTLNLEMAAVLEAIRHREELGSTGLGDGIAIPHARIDKLKDPFVLLACLHEALVFDAVDDKPVDIVCLILLPQAQGIEATKTLGLVAKCLRDKSTTAALRRAKTPKSAYDIIASR